MSLTLLVVASYSVLFTVLVCWMTAVLNRKLNVIHILVNSNLTAALQAEFDAVGREFVMMQEVIDIKRVAGHEPNTDTLAALKSTRDKLAELRAVLADRTQGAAHTAAYPQHV
jgi:hypothetical protein